MGRGRAGGEPGFGAARRRALRLAVVLANGAETIGVWRAEPFAEAPPPPLPCGGSWPALVLSTLSVIPTGVTNTASQLYPSQEHRATYIPDRSQEHRDTSQPEIRTQRHSQTRVKNTASQAYPSQNTESHLVTVALLGYCECADTKARNLRARDDKRGGIREE